MEIKNNTKVRQNLNTKIGKIAKISKGRSVTIVLERCDARKEQKKAVNKLRAQNNPRKRCDNLKQYAHQRKRLVAKQTKDTIMKSASYKDATRKDKTLKRHHSLAPS